jgi:coiled-coil domain-containing protein 130
MQGFNMGRYVPPDLEGTTSGNKLNKKRAPGTLRKDGTQTVRFEMPFAVWCTKCEPHAIIGQGVRFNAVKNKVGNYYSTPIWSFRMRHPACGGIIELQTDPKNTAYVVTEGGKARDYGDDLDRVREGENGVPILTPEERERRREDAFAALEGKVEQKAMIKDDTKRIEQLHEYRERNWDDTWSANKRLRDSFRAERKRLEREAGADEDLKQRIGTNMALLAESEEDRTHASLVTFGLDESRKLTNVAESGPMFRSPRHQTPSRQKSTKSAQQSRADILRRQLVSNTRAALNPFGS